LGTKKKIELEYPAKDKSSWGKFEYSYWLRGGGAQNEGIDLNYVAFKTDSTKYVIYDNYYSVVGKYAIGLKCINIITKEETNIPGKSKTQQGTLIGLRDNDLIKKGEELY
jgi:hypothetical protein